MKIPRNFKSRIAKITGLNFCDRYCDCGENNQLFWSPVSQGPLPEWVPDWMNGGDPDEIWRWLVENGKTEVGT